MRRHRLAQLAHRLVVPSLPQIDAAEAAIDLGAHRRVADAGVERRAIGIDGAVVVAAPPVHVGERQPRLGEPRAIDTHAPSGRRPLERRDGLVLVAAPRVGHAEQVQRARMIGPQLDGARQLRDRGVEIAAIEICRPELDVRAHVVGDDQVAELLGDPVDSVEDAHNRSRSAARRASISPESRRLRVELAARAPTTSTPCARRSASARSSTSPMPRWSASPAAVTKSDSRAAKVLDDLSKRGATAAAALAITSGAFFFACDLISPSTRPLSTTARIGAASVNRPPTSVLTNRKMPVPSAPSANTPTS